jgi:hypothetical protein
MSENKRDDGARGARKRLSRRKSLLAAAGAMAAPVISIGTARAGKGKKKRGNLAAKKCQRQVAQCRNALMAICPPGSGCEVVLACCDLFASCDAEGALTCIAP